MKKLSALCLIVFLFVAGCQPSESAVNTAIAQTQAAMPTSTPQPTFTQTLTYTPKPSSTPTQVFITTTPSIVPTITLTLKPFNTSKCRDLVINISETTTGEQVVAQLNKFNETCIRVVYDPEVGYLAINNFLPPFDNLKVKTDEETPPNIKVKLIKKPSNIWGLFIAPDTLIIRKVDELPSNQTPIRKEGLYAVGKDAQIAPGVWKSAQLPTWTDSCYWARLNSQSGDIKANNFGIGGVTVRVYEGEVFETNDNCLDWYYVGP